METPVLNTWKIPAPVSGEFTVISVSSGRPTVIVGANGSGKSALATWMVRQFPAARRLIAHRRLWFPTSGPDLSPSSRQQLIQNVSHWDQQLNSRYVDNIDGQRSSITLFDLLDKISDQNRRIVELYDEGNSTDAVDKLVGTRVIDSINNILAEANLHVAIQLGPLQTFVVHHKALSVEYPIHQMSDGERSALLLAAEVVGAGPESVFIIDEPERHLHPSISAGLIKAVINSRADCAFVVITHDLELAAVMSAEKGQAFVLSGCSWTDQEVTSWDMLPLPQGGDLPETARRAVLGGRKRVLLIEGDLSSLDRRIYSALYPGWLVYPAGGCEQVIRAVSGIRQASSLNWATAVGVVDLDGRTDAEVQALRDQGILTLPVSEVECLLYTSAVIEAVAARQAGTLGDSEEDSAQMVSNAIEEVFACLDESTRSRLAGNSAREKFVRSVINYIPKELEFSPVNFAVPFEKDEVKAKIDAVCAKRDIDELVSLVPIRDTAVRARAAASLRFKHFEDYEKAAVSAVKSSEDLANSLRSLIGELPA